jgi:hypothetical protein|tara:strand:+ start:3079 stop:3288 length:210 start_codon:yes stop_codon:yes gene_type:complete
MLLSNNLLTFKKKEKQMSKSNEIAREILEAQSQEAITNAEMEADFIEMEQRKRLQYTQEVINQIFGVYK